MIRHMVAFFVLCLMVTPMSVFAQSSQDGRCATADAGCDQSQHDDGSTKLDQRLGLMQQVLASEGRSSPVFGPAGAPANVDGDGAMMTVRFDDALTSAQQRHYEASGVVFEHRNGEPIRVNNIYLARVPWDALEGLAEDRHVRRIEPTWSPTLALPLEMTSQQVGAAQAQRHPDLEVDGEGVTVVDIDDGFDVFHPHMFRADGGHYEWHDENDSGRFDPGVDTVEIDGERHPLRILPGRPIETNWLSGDFQPNKDWLYADINGNQVRDFGTENGFSESDPAYGEPLFVVDDVDNNGVLDPGEKLVRLDTSKFSKIDHDGQSFVRGTNLIDATSVQPSTYHGTGVISILAGGQPGYHDRVGLAPGVDVIGHSYIFDQQEQEQGYSYDTQFYGISDAIESGAALVLHEWTDLVLLPPDGSTNIEQAMDHARAEGVIQVNPVGNLNQAGKHLYREVQAGEEVELGFHIDSGFQQAGQIYPYAVVYMSLYWRGDNQPEITLIGPDGNEELITLQSQSFGDANLYAAYEQTDRGTHQLVLYLWHDNPSISLDQGDYTIRLEGFNQDDAVMGRIADQYSNWGRGITWEDETIDYGTAVYPSSADSALGVAAYGGRHAGAGSAPGELRTYSGRGPRLDGEPMVTLAAPDDPYAAMTSTNEFGPHYSSPSSFMTFGGTSGAGPHVAASVALLADKYPDWDADAIEARLIESADTNGLVPAYDGLPNHHWGEGKVDVFAALLDTSRPPLDHPIPQVELQVFVDEDNRVVFDASQSSASDGAPLQYRFDLTYNGQWDTEWSDAPSLIEEKASFELDEEYIARVDARDPTGARSGALTTFALQQEDFAPDDEDDEASSNNDEDSPDSSENNSASEDVSEPEMEPEFDLVAVESSSCSTTSGGPQAFVFLALLFIVGIRRSKRKTLLSVRELT